MTRLWKLLKDNDGSVAIEYAVIAVGIAVVILAVAALVGDQLVNLFNQILAAFTA